MDRDIWTSDNPSANRLSTITEYSGIDDNEDHRSTRCNEEEGSPIPRGDPEQTLEDQAAVEHFLVDDSPMARFGRSIEWIYKKVSLESSSVKRGCRFYTIPSTVLLPAFRAEFRRWGKIRKP